jgi:hypothetical protein
MNKQKAWEGCLCQEEQHRKSPEGSLAIMDTGCWELESRRPPVGFMLGIIRGFCMGKQHCKLYFIRLFCPRQRKYLWGWGGKKERDRQRKGFGAPS